MKFITAYGSKNSVNLDFTDEVSLTKQSFAKESDINFIMAKYQKTGLIDHVCKYEGTYGDFLAVVDYQSSLNAVINAQEEFNSLPSSLRARFSNDPAQFLQFVNDDSNREEAIKIGLIDAPVLPVSSDSGSE